ncbi:hypothetical protein FRC07_009227, partial [Ceratobasidium sp. 392]
KRKIDEEDHISWNKAKAAAFVKDVEELQRTIESCDAEDFTKRLSDSLDGASTNTVQFVKELVAPILLDGHTNPKHCVQCHSTYLEKDNHSSACVIR